MLVRASFVVAAFASIAGCNQPQFIGPRSTSNPGTNVPIANDGGGGPDADPIGDTGIALDIGTVVTQASPPASIIGGTLLVMHDGHRAIAADPDRDALFVVDLDHFQRLAQIDLLAGDEPGRAVEDDAGHVHVVLRRAGAVATLDLSTLAITMRRAVCASPRGIAFDATARTLEVACASGEWVTLAAESGGETRSVFVDDDLRDIVVRTNDVVFSTFRTGELRVVGRNGALINRVAPADTILRPADGGIAAIDQHEVGWRLMPFHNGSFGLPHQQASTDVISTMPSGYEGDGCNSGIAHPAFSSFASDLTHATATATSSLDGVLGVDVAISPDDGHVAVAFAGNPIARGGRAGVMIYDAAVLASGIPCGTAMPVARSVVTTGQPVAIAYLSDGRLLIQNREPASLEVHDPSDTINTAQAVIALSPLSRQDSGHVLFHGNAGATIACASCHPEGGDDGHVWNFDTVGARRTQSIRGGILQTAPFHWSGEMATFGTLAHAVLGGRMGGGNFPQTYSDLLSQYVDRLPALPMAASANPLSVDRGHTLFMDPTVACASCHVPPLLTNNLTVSVGTGGAFQVPSLRGLRWRAPYMHNGCAATLRDRFGPCGGGELHGHTAALSASQIDDLLAYLRTL